MWLKLGQSRRTITLGTSESRGEASAPPPSLKSSSIGLKKRQNAPFSFYIFLNLGQNFVSNSGRWNHLPSLFSNFSRNFQNIVQIPSERTNTVLIFKNSRIAGYLTHPLDEVNRFAVLTHCSFKYRFKKCHYCTRKRSFF